jgi:hypothetical protein
MPDARDKEQRIRERAFQMWEEESRPVGKEKEHWERARKLMEEEDAIACYDQGLNSAAVRGSLAAKIEEVEIDSSIAMVFSGGG